MPELKNNIAPELKKYTLEDFEAEVEAERQRQVRWYQALVDSKNIDDFERLYPEEGKEYREAGDVVFTAIKKDAVRVLDSLKRESRLAYAAIINNFTSYFPGSFYRKGPFASNQKYLKKCADIDEALTNMGLNLDEVARLFSIMTPSAEERDRQRDIEKQAYVAMINKGYVNGDLRN